ncbi:MAG: ferritin-like domain-containing protein [Proteobacteria bacterium]|nr:ferritin-like domain-containing protein [Pseudomonadota bacterium]
MKTRQILAAALWGFFSGAFIARFGRFRRWPSRALVLDEPLALAEERTTRLRRLYANATRDAWDGEAVFREAVQKHGGIQLEREQREALAQILQVLMWGELAAWYIAAELAEGLDDADARLAASSQVFDEARHFYVLRDYMALLHVPMPPLDRYFTTGVRQVLSNGNLTTKLLVMQVMAEGAATAIFRSLMNADVEPVLGELLPLIEKDESRHVGLGVMHLPRCFEQMSLRELKRVRRSALSAGNLIGAANLRNADAYRTLGMDPREVNRSIDRVAFELIQKLQPIPGTEPDFIPVVEPVGARYERMQEIMLPEPGTRQSFWIRLLHRTIDAGDRVLPS